MKSQGSVSVGSPSTKRPILQDILSISSKKGKAVSSLNTSRTEELLNEGYSSDDTEDCPSPSFRLWLGNKSPESTFEEHSLASLASRQGDHTDLFDDSGRLSEDLANEQELPEPSIDRSQVNSISVGNFLDKPAQDALDILKGEIREDTRKTILTSLKKIINKNKIKNNKLVTLKDIITDRTVFLGLKHTINREHRFIIYKAIGIEEKEAVSIVNKNPFLENKHLTKLIEKDKKRSPLYGHDSLQKIIDSVGSDQRFSEEISSMLNYLSDRQGTEVPKKSKPQSSQPASHRTPNSANRFSALDAVDTIRDVDGVDSLREALLQSDIHNQGMDELTTAFQAIVSYLDKTSGSANAG